ncbi:PIN domain-containing protein [Emticicia sp.]|uniref:PIN domain-containing protein n=1 Tax=Emticicia sp. TaxID=1930953 RepID=UPI003751EBC1
MILVDSSVWIGYLRSGENAEILQTLVNLDLVCTNEIILSELIPALQHRKQTTLIESLEALPCIPHTIFWEGIRALQLLNLQYGINKVGLPDLMIAQQCITNNIELCSLDKHFQLMATHTSLKLMEF